MKKNLKKTKIICSVGPSTQNWKNFKGIVEAGMNVARINFSHASDEEKRIDEELIKRANDELGANIATLYDTKGPDLRTCTFEGDTIDLVEGRTIKIVEEDLKDKGNADHGFYKLVVTEVGKGYVTCKIENSGTITSRRGVCIPGVKLDIPYVSEKDKEDIKYACDKDGDFLAISFVNSADNIREVRDLCKKYGKPNMTIISKVETQYAMDNLKEIVAESDYIMVARGDLGVETGLQNLPLYQQMMIDECHAQGKGVIMATQMMTSMKHNIRPTNAEVTDVANAVLLGCDAIMTSDETTMGEYPVETIEYMANIAYNTEKITKYRNSEFHTLRGNDIHNAIAKCAVEASEDLELSAIIASTLSGKTAIDVSCLRPKAHIIATVTDIKVARQLALKWGVYCKLVPTFKTTDDIVKSGAQAAKEILGLNNKDLIGVIGGSPLNAHTNFIKIQEVGE